MIRIIFISSLFIGMLFNSCSQQATDANTAETKTTTTVQKSSAASSQTSGDLPKVLSKGNYNKLDDIQSYVILEKGTERSFTGKYHDSKKKGTYLCAQCNLPLFTSESKFDSGTGWPSFDDGYAEGNVKEETDADGYRTEILCGNCGGHLGHVFKNEGFTKKNTRHCVNSASLSFKETN